MFLGYFASKFVPKNFHKLPNQVTLAAAEVILPHQAVKYFPAENNLLDANRCKQMRKSITCSVFYTYIYVVMVITTQ